MSPTASVVLARWSFSTMTCTIGARGPVSTFCGGGGAGSEGVLRLKDELATDIDKLARATLDSLTGVLSSSEILRTWHSERNRRNLR